jgi:EpsI family protein
VPIAIFSNGIRVAGTGIAAHFVGPEAAQGFFHTFSGWLVFVVAGALMLLVHRLALWLVPSARTARQAENRSGANESNRTGSATGLSLLPRTTIVAVCFVGVALGLSSLEQTETTPLREPLTKLPTQIGPWSGGQDAPRLSKEIEAILDVDEYLNRDYTAPDQPGVGLYIGYRGSQRQGQTMHTPLVCLPGAGWEAISRDLVSVQVAGPAGSPARTVEINRMVVQKGLDQMFVFYWFQGRGRIVASEYWVKFYSLVDVIRLNRGDGAMVRIIAPINTRNSGSEQRAERASLDFASRLLSVLGKSLPD